MEVPLEVDSDSYVVFMARGLNARSMSADERLDEGRMDRAIIPHGAELTEEKVGRLFEELQCDHGATVDDGHGYDHGHHHSH